jgi:hypothetical protein
MCGPTHVHGELEEKLVDHIKIKLDQVDNAMDKVLDPQLDCVVVGFETTLPMSLHIRIRGLKSPVPGLPSSRIPKVWGEPFRK